MTDEMGLQTEFVDDRAASRELRKATLVVVDGPDAGESFVVDQESLHVGRASVNDAVVDDRSISSIHFELRAEDEGFLLRDADSTNGTKIAGCRIESVYLEPDVEFRAGNSVFRLEPLDETVDVPMSDDDAFHGIVGRSPEMREVFATLDKIASSELTCLVRGETGTGKERAAQALHDASRRSDGPYVVLDCSAIPPDLMESYVFGHEKGAFTGAVEQKEGAFERAEGGTLFLDEIGELSPELQPKLLRVLEEGTFKRVGGTERMNADVRVVAATHRELRRDVNEGTFREDLYFRLSVVDVELPPLADRTEDIPLLVDHFLDDVAEQLPDRPRPEPTAEAMEKLMNYSWPGNVRELKNAVRRAAHLADGSTLGQADLRLEGGFESAVPSETDAADMLEADFDAEFKTSKQQLIDAFEREYCARLYEAHDRVVSHAAEAAGLSRYHFRNLLEKHGLK